MEHLKKMWSYFLSGAAFCSTFRSNCFEAKRKHPESTANTALSFSILRNFTPVASEAAFPPSETSVAFLRVHTRLR